MSINGRLQKIDKVLPPSWDSLWRLVIQVSGEPTQNERRALQSVGDGNPADHDRAIFDAWITKNQAKVYAAWDKHYPGWEDAPLWDNPPE